MKDYVIAISGEAGQGINTIGDMLALVFQEWLLRLHGQELSFKNQGWRACISHKDIRDALFDATGIDLVVPLSKSTTLSQIEYFPR